MKEDSNNSTTLIFKNIPKQIDDLSNLLNSLKIPAKEVKPFGRKRALITYELKTEAEQALDALRKLEFSGKTVNVSLFCQNKPTEEKKDTTKLNLRKSHKSVQASIGGVGGTPQLNGLTHQQVNKYVQKLYAVEEDLCFNQPPPPYLKYNYPPINKDVLDNICITLLSNKRFYTQVLHLMNRMNLEPPFGVRSYKFTAPGSPQEAGTQTEDVIIQQPLQLKQNEEELESELESSEDEVLKEKPGYHIKRKLPPQEEQYKKKARRMLQTVQKLNKGMVSKKLINTNLCIKEIFDITEQGTPIATTTKIDLNLKRPATPKLNEIKEPTKSLLNLPIDLKTQKLSLNELEKLTIFKNYQKGASTNKLYIKNLHKDVNTDDLRLIYERYITDNDFNLDIKVMQHGRMKGQAFVTFQGKEIESIKSIIEQALEETNGFVLRDKPMVVCYGKQF